MAGLIELVAKLNNRWGLGELYTERMTPIERLAHWVADKFAPRCEECGVPVAEEDAFCSEAHADAYNATHAW